MYNALNSKECRSCIRQTGRAGYAELENNVPQLKRARRYGQQLLSFFGKGDYTLKSNSLVDGGGGVHDNLKISYGNTDREVRIVYREYLRDIITSPDGSFKLEAFNLNPSDPNTFPWLAGMADHWDQFTMNGCMFEFKSTASDSNTGNRSIGSIMMATEYDLFDDNYSSKQTMMNSAYANESKVSNHVIHGIECAKGDTFNPIMFTGDVPTGADKRDYSLGRFQVATVGGATGSADNVGSLYVHYDITFRKEQIPVQNLDFPNAGVLRYIPTPGLPYGPDSNAGLELLRPAFNLSWTVNATFDNADLFFDVDQDHLYCVTHFYDDVGIGSVSPVMAPDVATSNLEKADTTNLLPAPPGLSQTRITSADAGNCAQGYYKATASSRAFLRFQFAVLGATLGPNASGWVSVIDLGVQS